MSFGKRQPAGDRRSDRRRHSRRPTDVPADIVLPTGQSVKCRVANYSNSGARLNVASAFGLPDSFELRAGGRTYQARVLRRENGRLAVKFV